MNEQALFAKLDKIISLLEESVKEPKLINKILNGMATGAGILGILSVIDIIRLWLRG